MDKLNNEEEHLKKVTLLLFNKLFIDSDISELYPTFDRFFESTDKLKMRQQSINAGNNIEYHLLYRLVSTEPIGYFPCFHCVSKEVDDMMVDMYFECSREIDRKNLKLADLVTKVNLIKMVEKINRRPSGHDLIEKIKNKEDWYSRCEEMYKELISQLVKLY